MTASATRSDREDVLACSMDDHIAKPIDPQVVFETMARWIGTPGSRVGVLDA